MFKSENCKFRAKTLKADEAVSGRDTARRPEKFAAEIRNLQLKDSFSAVPLIIDNYDSFTYNVFQYCAELHANPQVRLNDELKIGDIKKGGFTHIIISPGPGSPLKKKDFGICSQIIKKFSGKIPILGICLGHQGIACALGGRVVRAPAPVHGKRSSLKIDNSNPLFKGLPKTIEAMRYHSLVVSGNNFPSQLRIVAKTADGLIMAFAHEKFPLFGVQFHPESIGTPHGKKILKNFLAQRPAR